MTKQRSFRIGLLGVLAVLLGVAMMMVPAPAQGAQIAASIDYELTLRPSSVPDTFQATPGTSLQFLAIKAIDGFRINAALWQPGGKQPADTTLVVMALGDNNYHSPPQSTLGRGLAEKGYAALAINTRNHDGNIYSQNFLDLRRDIEAAVQTARALGYRSLVLQGHSQGNIHVQFYAATSWDRDIKGVILLGAFANLPWKTRNLLVQNEENFSALIDASAKALRGGTLGAELPVKMHSFTGQDVPITAQHFLTYRWDKTSVADGTFWIHRIPNSILLVRDQSDAFIPPFEPYMLLSAAHSEGSLVAGIKYVMLPNSKPPSPQSHYFIGNEQALINAVAGWLAEQRL
jgi:pimeloyl-ACP methyl ester carboxylesterase